MSRKKSERFWSRNRIGLKGNSMLSEPEKQYYTRQITLWGEEVQDTLKKKKIAIIGSGGLGCSLGIALGSAGVGTLHITDFDTVSEHNIHRQIAFRTEDVGKAKSEILKNLIKARNPFVDVFAYLESFEDFIRHEKEIDLILDATDNLPSRAAIDAHAREKSIPWVYASVEQWHGQVCLFEKASFSDNMQVTDRKPGGIAPPIVMQVASFQANLALQYLCGMDVESDVLYYLNMKDSADIRKFRLPVD